MQKVPRHRHRLNRERIYSNVNCSKSWNFNRTEYKRIHGFLHIDILCTGQYSGFQKWGGGRLAHQDIIGGRDATPPKPWVLTRAEYSNK